MPNDWILNCDVSLNVTALYLIRHRYYYHCHCVCIKIYPKFIESSSICNFCHITRSVKLAGDELYFSVSLILSHLNGILNNIHKIHKIPLT